MPLQNVSRLYTITSALDAGIGVFLMPLSRIQIVQMGYSYSDTSATFVPGTGVFQARAALVRGSIDFDPATFVAATDLGRFGINLIGDFFINDVGPGIIPFHPDTDESWIEGDEGLTLLLSKGVATPAGATHFIGKLVPASRYMRHGGFQQHGQPGGAGGAGGAGGGGSSPAPPGGAALTPNPNIGATPGGHRAF